MALTVHWFVDTQIDIVFAQQHIRQTMRKVIAK